MLIFMKKVILKNLNHFKECEKIIVEIKIQLSSV